MTFPDFLVRRIVPVLFLILLALLALVGSWSANGVANPESSPPIDVPLTLDVVTPHVAWGKPSPGQPVRAFVVPSVSEGRTLVELAERMDLKFDTVMIDEAWDVNTWTVGTGKDYEARNYKLVYQYLDEALTKAIPYDVIVLPSLHGWNRLPAASREAVRNRVEQGTGLVLIHPTTGIPAADDPQVTGPLNNFAPDREVAPGSELWELSPLVGVLSDRLEARGFREIRPDAIADGAWKKVSEHFITSNLPLDSFPTDFLKYYRYRLGKDSTPLISSAEGEPILATKMFGKGRVVALGYVNTGLSPMIDWKILGVHHDHWWEYFYSMLCRSILWAAQREPALKLGAMAITEKGYGEKSLSVEMENSIPLTQAAMVIQIFDEWGESEARFTRTVQLKPGKTAVVLQLPSRLESGRHRVDIILEADGKHYDWGSTSFHLAKPDEILSLSTDRLFYKPGDRVQVKFQTKLGKPAKFLLELLDNRGRLIGRRLVEDSESRDSETQAMLEVGNYSTNIGWLRLTLLSPNGDKERKVDQKQMRVNFSSLDRNFGAYELIMPWHGPPTYQPWTPTLDQQFRKIGVSVVEDPERNFKLIRQINTPGFGVYWHYRQKYLEQKDRFLETGDKKFLVRDPDLASEGWLEKLRDIIGNGMQRDKLFQPLAYYLADESSLTAYGDPFDLSWSAPTLAKFRTWLKTQYANLASLNQEWASQFSSWDEIQPLTTAEAQAKGNFAGWMDHRTFMEEVFAHALQVAAETVKQVDAEALPSISGTQEPGPSNALNWYRLDQIVDYLQPYSEDDQDELHRTMRPGLILTGFTGYERNGTVLRHELWHRLFHGQVGASLFWHYTALNADLSLTQQGRDLAETIDEFRNQGLAVLLRGAERENCGIAVHYSLLSVRGQWITDGHIQPHELSNGDSTSAHLRRFHSNRHAWLQALEDAGYQYDFQTTEQIEIGKLEGYRVLILPDSIALSDEEVAAIRQFVEKGGLLLSDAETGLMDNRGRWQVTGRLDDVLGVRRSQVRSAASDLPATKVRLTLSSRVIDCDVVPADPRLRATTSRPGFLEGDTPFLLENRFGEGRSISLNFWMSDYESLRQTPRQAQRLAWLHEALNQAGIRPLVNFRKATGAPLTCSEIVTFRKGNSKYVAILSEPGCADAGEVILDLPEPRYAYHLRAHQGLGRLAQIRGTLVAGQPLFYALLPAPLGRLTLKPLGPSKGVMQVKAGDIVKFSVHLRGNSGERVPECAAHMEVRNPAGKILDYYSGNYFLNKGVAEFTVPLALNDPPGLWQVTAREPFTQQTARTTFKIIR